MKDKISIIIPCFNEEESLPIFYKEIDKVSKKIKEANFEFIFIDDGSTDHTLEEIKKRKKKDKRVHYLSFSRNFGKEAGMLAGLRHAKGNYAAIMDCDIQDPPEKIIEMYQEIKKGEYDCIALYSINHRDYKPLRRFLTREWYKLIARISPVEQKAGERDFRLMTREMIDSILSLREVNRYTKGIFSYIGFRTMWLEYESPNRVAGESKYNLKSLLKYAVEGIISFQTTPLYISFYIGITLCIISFLSWIIMLIRMILYKIEINSLLMILSSISFLSGLNFIMIGIIGIYLSKVYLEVKDRPLYIIKEKDI